VKNIAPVPVNSTHSIGVDVVEPGSTHRRGWMKCSIGRHIEFNTADLESYLFAAKDAVVYDALLLAAAVEFADRRQRRPALTWRREIALRLPVHDPSRWKDPRVADSLKDALTFLTGDFWELDFYQRSRNVDQSHQETFDLPPESLAVIPFSDGLDSRAAAGLMTLEHGNKLIRVRLGSKEYDGHHPQKRPLAAEPYRVRAAKGEFVESSARSRGFKFSLISGLAAYLAKASQVIVPESGQGSLGPALVTVGQSHEDYRNHPFFTGRMEKFLLALLGQRIRFQFPRIWYTKAETLKKFVAECEDGSSWAKTWSCWQDNRHVSVDGKRRHCGVCAACILRRLSVHAAGLNEPPETYIWEKLNSATFSDGAAANFSDKKKTGKLREYAIAGILHLDHLATLRASPANSGVINLTAFKLGRSLEIPESDARDKLDRLLVQHEKEWKAYMASLGSKAFVADWAVGVQ
jgi:hypothetical protein